MHRGISAKAQEASLMHPARPPQLWDGRCCLFIHGISADGTGTLTTGLAVRRGRNGLASCQSACHSSDEPRAGSADLHTDHSVVREPHIQKTPCGHMAASAVVCGRPERPLRVQKAVPCHSCMHHTPHGVYTLSRVDVCMCRVCAHTPFTHTHTHTNTHGSEWAHVLYKIHRMCVL